MTTTHSPAVRSGSDARRAPRSVVISAWAIPIMIIGQFAMLAIVPVALVVIGTLRDVRLRALRWWAAALAVAYATPLVLWAIGPDRAGSLSKDMDPILAGIVVAVSVAVLVALYATTRRSSRSAADDVA